MGERAEGVKLFSLFAFLGFAAGAIAYTAFFSIWPGFMEMLAMFIRNEFARGVVLSGISGALLTLLMLLIYAYVSK